MAGATLETIAEEEATGISGTQEEASGTDYTLTFAQAARMLSIGQLGKARNPSGNTQSGTSWASQFVSRNHIPTERMGFKKLVRLGDFVNAAIKKSIITREFYNALLSQKPHHPKPAVRKREFAAMFAASKAVPAKASLPTLLSPSQPAIRPAFKPAPSQAQQHSSYVTELLPPYTLPLPKFEIDFSQMPAALSRYEYSAQLHQSGKGPFAGLEAKVAIYHPSLPGLVNEIRDSRIRVVYHPGLNELGVITGILKDAKTSKFVGVSVDFKGEVIPLIVDAAAQNANPPNPKIWGPPSIGR